MTVTVKKVDGGSVTVSGASFRRLRAIKANLRRGYQVEMMPYPDAAGKWLIRVVKPKNGNVTTAEVDSYFEVMAKSKEDAEAFIKKDGLWGGALAERVAKKIGDRGEAHALAKLIGPSGIVDGVTGKSMKFNAAKQYQNASGHGLDILAQISEVAPPPPPRVGDFFAFEVKSTLGAFDDPPRLSKAQKNPGKSGGFVETRLTNALKGNGGYQNLPSAERRFIQKALAEWRSGNMQYRKIDIRMDHSGALASVGGKPPMEVKPWQ